MESNQIFFEPPSFNDIYKIEQPIKKFISRISNKQTSDKYLREFANSLAGLAICEYFPTDTERAGDRLKLVFDKFGVYPTANISPESKPSAVLLGAFQLIVEANHSKNMGNGMCS